LEEENEFSGEDVLEVWDWSLESESLESESLGGAFAASLAASINLQQGFQSIRRVSNG